MKRITKNYDENRIAVLDAVRAISVFFIVWYHLWEQNWMTPYIELDGSILRYIGIEHSYLQLFVRYGVIFIETFFLLSAICNFIPYAKSIVYGTPWPDMWNFYKKRMIRILPSYLLAVIVPFLLTVFSGNYSGKAGYAIVDLLSNLTFTNVLIPPINGLTLINGVVWTLQIEFWFYLAFPFAAKLFKKKPIITFCVAWVVTIILNKVVIYHMSDRYHAYGLYNPFTYLGIYANGFLITMVYFYLKKRSLLDNKYLNLLSIVGFIMSSVWLCKLLFNNGQVNKEVLMVEQKIQLEMLFTAMVFCLMLSGNIVNKFCANRIFIYVSGISYNLYLWHQIVMLKCKEWHIPSYEGDVSPNQLGDMVWSRKYSVISVLVIILIAHLLTDFYEIPITQKLKRKFRVTKNINHLEVEDCEEIVE